MGRASGFGQSQEMKIETIQTKRLKPNPANPRTIRDDKFRKLVQSIREFPKMLEIRPIVVNAQNEVLGGNMRLRACIEAGLTEVPIIRAETLTDDEQRRFIITDNAGFGEWDWEALANEWDAEELSEWGLDVPDFAANTKNEAEEDDYEIPEEIKTDIVLGDLFEIGPHRLLCGDSANLDDVARLMDGAMADMSIADPPYGVAYVGKTKDALKIENDDLDENALEEINKKWFDGVDLSVKPGGYVLATVPAGPPHLIFALDWKQRGWLRQIMVWNKSVTVLGYSEYHYKHEPILFGWKPGGERLKNSDRTKTTVWDFEKPAANRDHPTMKPVALFAYAIGNHTRKREIVYDPFIGSGTTMVAAHQLDRKCYGMEIDTKYCQVIVDRMLKLDPSLEVKRNGQPYDRKAQNNVETT